MKQTHDYLFFKYSNKYGVPIRIVPIATKIVNKKKGLEYPLGLKAEKNPKKIVSIPPVTKIIFPLFMITVSFFRSLSYWYLIINFFGGYQ